MGVLIVVRFVVCYFMSILVLQSSYWEREGWLLCLVVSRDCCVALPRGAIGLSWYFLVIPTYYLCIRHACPVAQMRNLQLNRRTKPHKVPQGGTRYHNGDNNTARLFTMVPQGML